MNKENEIDIRLLKANMLKSSATRLVRLLELNAPDLIIEHERYLLAKRIIGFPAERQHIEERERTDSLIEEEKENHLLNTGFYENIEKELK